MTSVGSVRTFDADEGWGVAVRVWTGNVEPPA
jgi:hypothetical protein